MATSGYIKKTTSFGYVQLEWELISQDAATNKSKISYTLFVHRATSDFNSTAAKSYSITFDGVKVASGTVSLAGSGTKQVKYGTTTITHNVNGSKTFTYSFVQDIGLSYGTVSGSGNGTLTQIQRVSTPTLSTASADMGSAITITTNRVSSTLTHTLKYSFGSASGTIASNVGASHSWTIPLTLAAQIPNVSSGTCTVTCQTYSGSTLIGSKTVNFTAKVPSSVIPTISSITTTETTAEVLNKFDFFIQNKSRIKVDISASGAQGSTIKTYKTAINGVNYSGSSFTSGLIGASGVVFVTSTVTDSRGRTASKTVNITLIPYSSPTIASFSVSRVLADGTENGDGTHAKIAFNFAISPLNEQNNKSYVIEYKRSGETDWISITSGSVYSSDGTLTSASSILNINSSYDVRLTVRDYFTAVYATANIPTAFTLYDILADGTGWAFGKVAEESNLLDIALKTRHLGGLWQVVLPENSDFDNVRTPNTYTLKNASTSNYLNCPFNSGTGTLTVEECGEAGQVCQIVKTCNMTDTRELVRFYLKKTENEWVWSDWISKYQTSQSVMLKGSAAEWCSDLDDLSAVGIYTGYSSLGIGNKPSGMTYWTLFVLPYDPLYRIRQIAIGSYGETGTIKIQARISYHNSGDRSWGAWTTII